MDAGFEQWGGDTPASPVIVSVPHAGRDYPPALLAASRVARGALRSLEDRHVEAVAALARGRETMLVQRRARAWIDLNRSEHDRDPAVDAGAPAGARPSAKVRGGLGLVPARTVAAGALWFGRFAGEEIERRIVEDHRPYHARLAALLATARARFGAAILLDLHSMPPLGAKRARVVIGDRFGTTAGARFSSCTVAVAEAAGLRVTVNSPYAGGHVVERHGDPARGIHALQVELDRSLYLDTALDETGEGLTATAALVRAMIAALAEEAGLSPMVHAAE